MNQFRRGILVGVILLLLLGAIVNVVVAWGCVLNPWRATQRFSLLNLSSELVWWRAIAPEGMREPLRAVRLSIPGVDQDLLTGEPCSAANLRVNEWLVEETIRMHAGFPMRSLSGTVFNYVRPSPDNRTTQQFDGIVRPPAMFVSKSIEYQRPHWPLEPLWPGFAINTVFYAAMLWMLFAFPFALRRIIRRRRGQCVRCGYDLRGQATSDDTIMQIICPECGGMDRPKA